MKQVSIIGGGPAALMLAAQIDTAKYSVTIYEKKKTVGRKFLVAGEGGLNLTFSTSEDALIQQYHPSGFMAPIIRGFNNQDFINWLNQLGISTFVGSSNRVFPKQGVKPIEVLKTIVDYVATRGVQFKFNTKWTGWNRQGDLTFENEAAVTSDIVVFALGGASWKVTGSTGSWKSKFEKRHINVLPFRAANCAFGVNWQTDFINIHEGKPLKNIALTFNNVLAKGELVISKFGLEGNAIYALSQKIQDRLLTEKEVIIYLDLKPKMAVNQIRSKYKNARRSKVTDILKNDLNLDRTAISLLKQFTDKNTFSNPDALVQTIKAVPVVITSAGPLDEAISSLGGMALDEVDANFQCKKYKTPTPLAKC
ncbi:TIGR03862 family flavoprotein [Algibacter lectus]|uniref:NAD(FAD)-utilizing dehydrogenases n=1 Tax=Algibacter lectus TaxID=221126 RepID=A0A090V8T6_9FLAO|nr:TIGR03862 family flavoprotein [Algibacter lectus]GAL61265.1 NAD(FAD)-utilizing dehydrogenases [Algibacter lectus]